MGTPQSRAAGDNLYDESRVAITLPDLNRSFSALAMSDDKNYNLISRANESGLQAAAYSLYAERLKLQPQDFYTNLWVGLSAESYRESLLNPLTHGMQPWTSSELETINRLRPVADTAFKNAVRLNPNSGFARSEYGYFLFFQGENRTDGLKFLKEGVKLGDRDPRTHRLLGRVLSYPFQTYDPDTAEAELQQAARMDNMYAGPHWDLARMYEEQGKKSAAQKELAHFLELVPPAQRSTKFIKYLQSRINKLTEVQRTKH